MCSPALSCTPCSKWKYRMSLLFNRGKAQWKKAERESSQLEQRKMSKGTRDERAWSSAPQRCGPQQRGPILVHPAPVFSNWEYVAGFGCCGAMVVLELKFKKNNNLGEEKTSHLDITEALHSGELRTLCSQGQTALQGCLTLNWASAQSIKDNVTLRWFCTLMRWGCLPPLLYLKVMLGILKQSCLERKMAKHPSW